MIITSFRIRILWLDVLSSCQICLNGFRRVLFNLLPKCFSFKAAITSCICSSSFDAFINCSRDMFVGVHSSTMLFILFSNFDVAMFVMFDSDLLYRLER